MRGISKQRWGLFIVASALASLAPIWGYQWQGLQTGLGGAIGFEVFLVWKCGMNLSSGWWFQGPFLRFHCLK